MSAEVFCFLQVELPFALGAPDGRWLVRREADREVERVIVLRTVGASRADAPGRRRRPTPVPGLTVTAEEIDPRAGSVQVTRATVVDPASLADEREAEAWLARIDAEAAIEEVLRWLNRLVQAHRIAAADAYAHELGAGDALAVRAGFGEGEQVAEGRWLRALALPAPRAARRGRRREAARQARVHERLAALLGSRRSALLCEELALRARRDLDEGRLRHAAIELERAYASALVELREPIDVLLEARLDELRELKPPLTELAVAAIATDGLAGGQQAVLEHALRRLEAALRARASGQTDWGGS